jgi:hypothetical protein
MRQVELAVTHPDQRKGSGPFTDEGVAFAGDTATGMMPVAHRVAGVGPFGGS